MGYFQPLVMYKNPEDKREHSVIRYIGHRVLNNNKNFLCALVGATGAGKSYGCLGIAELYSKQFGIPFDPNIHVVSSLKELLILITADDVDKKVGFGSIIVFDEPQIEANAREWQSEMNKALSQLVSTFRNQRLVVLFAVPYLEMIDKQSRVLFHGEFKVEGYDKTTKFTHIKPRFLEWNKNKSDFYRKRLAIWYKTENKIAFNKIKLHSWDVPLASAQTIETYEAKKKKFTDDLNKKLLHRIELNEKQQEGRDKSADFQKVKELFDFYGEDYEKIMEQMPHLQPYSIEKYISFIKRSRKHGKRYKTAKAL
jgi:hypothetical protein